MFQLIYIFLLRLIFNCFPLFFVMGMFADEFEMVPTVQCNQLIKQQLCKKIESNFRSFVGK